MVQLTLTPDEAAALRQVLSHYLSDLRMEIADTDAARFRERLKEEEAFLNRVIAQLGGLATAKI